MKPPTTSSKSRLTGLAMTALLVLTGASLALGAQETQGTHLAWNVESREGPEQIDIFVAPEHLRMDMGQENSMIYRGGDMIMVMHAEQAYMVFTEEMMEQMGAMMGAMGRQQQEQMQERSDFDTPPSFTRTGNTKQVGSWDAYEVEVTHPEQTGSTTIWFSEDVDLDLMTFLTQMTRSVEAFASPMMQGMGRGGGGGAAELGMLGAMRDQLGQMDLPAGFPVQIISVEDGETNTMTLTRAEQGPMTPDTFQPPSGYQEMRMPGIRR